MSKIRFPCAECGEILKVSEKLLGRKFRCKYCQKVFRVSKAEAEFRKSQANVSSKIADLNSKHAIERPSKSSRIRSTPKPIRKLKDSVLAGDSKPQQTVYPNEKSSENERLTSQSAGTFQPSDSTLSEEMISHETDPESSNWKKKAQRLAVEQERAESIRNLLDAFKGSIKDFEPTVKLQKQTGATRAHFCVCLYWATLLMLAVSIVAHAIFNIKLITGEVNPITFGLYIGPIMGGIILIGFLLKSAVAMRWRPSPRHIKRSNEPVFMSFVNLIAKQIGCSPPERIELDYTLDASLIPLDGFFSTSSDKFVLRIGIPLITGLQQNQLACILANEISLYSKWNQTNGGMLAWRVQQWFKVASSELDSVDKALVSKLQRKTLVYRLLGLAAPLYWIFAFFARQIFRCFRAVSGLLLVTPLKAQRQVQDQLVVELVGPECFSSSLYEHRFLRESLEFAIRDLVDSIDSKYAVNDVFESMVVKRKNITPDRTEFIRLSKNWCSDGDLLFSGIEQRIELANEFFDRDVPVFSSTNPSRQLLRGYVGLSQQCTQDLKQTLNKSISKAGKSLKGRNKRREKIAEDYIRTVVHNGLKIR